MAGVVSVVVMATAAGCLYDDPRPAQRPVTITALSLVDNVPTAMFAPCGGRSVYRVKITGPATNTAARPGEAWKGGSTWATQRLDDSAVVGALALFTVPDGWYAEAGNTTGFDHLVADEPYVLYTSESTQFEGPADMAAEVPFTLADLQALGAGEVWARVTPDAPPTAMSETDFRTAAATSCAAPPPSPA